MGARTWADAFKAFLIWLVRPVYQFAKLPDPRSAESPTDRQGKVLKLLDIWKDKGILSADESAEMQMIIRCERLPGELERSEAPYEGRLSPPEAAAIPPGEYGAEGYSAGGDAYGAGAYSPCPSKSWLSRGAADTGRFGWAMRTMSRWAQQKGRSRRNGRGERFNCSLPK